MTTVLRGIGGLLMVYAVLYLVQYIFSALYDNPQRVWDVMNVASGVGILIALAVNFHGAHSQSFGESSTPAPGGRPCSVLRERRPGDLVLPQLDKVADPGGRRVHKGAPRGGLAAHCGDDPSRARHDGMEAMAGEFPVTLAGGEIVAGSAVDARTCPLRCPPGYPGFPTIPPPPAPHPWPCGSLREARS